MHRPSPSSPPPSLPPPPHHYSPNGGRYWFLDNEVQITYSPLYNEAWDDDDDMPVKLGAAMKFLNAVHGVPFAFRSVDAMFYISNFESKVEYLKRSFQTLRIVMKINNSVGHDHYGSLLVDYYVQDELDISSDVLRFDGETTPET